MDAKIVKFAYQVLEKNATEQHDEVEKDRLDKRITRIENTLNIIVNKLNDLTEK